MKLYKVFFPTVEKKHWLSGKKKKENEQTKNKQNLLSKLSIKEKERMDKS